MKTVRQIFVGLAAIALSAAAAEAQRRVTGQVTEQGNGAPLAGAQLNVVGTTIGAIAGEDGRFSIAGVPEGTQSIRVRRIGYQQRVAPLPAGTSELNVQLIRDVLQLETQVVTGAATTINRRNAANDVAQVSSEQLNRAPTPTVENALQGKIAGANIVTNSGAPGGGAQFRIRGASSILGNADPLIIVDGVIISNDAIQPGTNAVLGASGGSNASSQDNGVNRIADINPNDIENIEVLKGASASQIYGSRAGNGVIIITTKRGTNTAPQFAFTQRVGGFALQNKIDERRFTLDEAIEYGEDFGLTEQEVTENYQRCNGFCDHQEDLFGNSPLSYESNLSVRGGSPVAQYFVSGLLKRDAGIASNTGYNKQSLRANLNTTLSPRITASVNTQLVHSLTQRGFSNNDNVNVTPYFVFPSTPSFFDLRPVNGVYPDNPFTSSNPLATFALSKTPEEVWRLLGSATLNYSLLNTERQNLDFRLTGGIDQFNQQNSVVTPRELQFEPADNLPGTATYQSGTNVYGNGGVALTHTLRPQAGVSFTTSVGAQNEYRSQRTANIVSRDVLSGQENIQRGSASEPFDFRLRQIDQAFYAQEEVLALDERLLVTGALRGQRSSINGDATKFYVFPKASASFRVPTDFVAQLNEVKLRAAYGKAGNPPLATSQFTPLVGAVYGGQNGVQLSSRVGDPNIKPELQTEIEGGIDIAAFSSRASLSVTGYRRNITDLLIRPALAPSTGITNRDINAGELQNTGLEISAGVTPFQSQRGSLISRLTFARNVGKVVSLPDIVGRVQCLNADRTAIQTDPTQCPRGFTGGAFGFEYGQGRLEEGASPTQIVSLDTIPGGNGATYQRKYGDTEPQFSLGLSNELTLGPVRLYGLFDWRHDFQIVNITQSSYDAAHTFADTAGSTRRNEAFAVTAPYVQDGSFVKLRELTLSYVVPQQLTGRLFGGRTSNVSLELSGRNLVTWTDYEGVDPEVSNFGNQNIVRNQDLAPFPPSRSFFLSLNAGF
ncbi:MAG: Outer membrane TonB-dependent transporter, utilization system for glycans and polysaccharides (PUL), SusC family [uncultured Gemmatimonadaceae bacterium]|uniref:Outer membrane TonB-dependent transporter, utilization system for glycans and polysaccharides (PUL), SusC family n=2 Tax=uncultured Gemmatimonadaceae bacterium TaxID=246130 RepID=A0A6J4KE87_9BACT|nr:MAG: Outer membrane TonB-dependent transporter, utilization system for glycans and polysaccharides (PUL), SusC family [uncultured Gemmatimonadaceae bacterium]